MKQEKHISQGPARVRRRRDVEREPLEGLRNGQRVPTLGIKIAYKIAGLLSLYLCALHPRVRDGFAPTLLKNTPPPSKYMKEENILKNTEYIMMKVPTI